MTNEQARRIAEAAIAARDAGRDLHETEARGAALHTARDQRRALSAAEAELNAAITAAVER